MYDWICDNTFRDPKTRGCGVGDIKFMLETKNLSGKCADLNALFVGLARAARIPARDVYGIRVAESAARLQEPRRKSGEHHQGAALPRRVLHRRATAGCRPIRRTCARWCWRRAAEPADRRPDGGRRARARCSVPGR
ncbi:MAG: transglutaminase-like domain-containing protein [Comamonadaceae bacterium]|nr:transglutaminase-like domain-containing protein [Comamonadaceae bacterium]